MRDLYVPLNVETKELIEGHPLEIQKIIQGDLREKTWVADNTTHKIQNTSGKLIYNKTDRRDRPWFVLVLTP